MTYEHGQVCKCGNWMPQLQKITLDNDTWLYLYQCIGCRAVDLHYMDYEVKPNFPERSRDD